MAKLKLGTISVVMLYQGSTSLGKASYNNYNLYFTKGEETQRPCYAVVDDISYYLDTEFDDVYNKADNKWYKLNNLNQYELYGVYGSGRTITTYEGKLTIDNGYEYQYSGNTWVNVGEVVSGTNSYRYWMWRSIGDLGSQNIIQFSEFDLVVNGSDASLSLISGLPSGFNNEGLSNLFDDDTSTKYCASFTSYKTTNYILFETQTSISPTVFSMTTANDNSTNDRYPREWVLYGSNTSTTDWNDGSWNMVLSGTCGSEMLVDYTRFNYNLWSTDVYPLYYDVMQAPPDNVTFSSMTEAESYECPWYGMSADIDNTAYLFCETNEWLTKYIYQEVSGEYMCYNHNKYKKMQEYDRNVDGTTSATTNYVVGDLIESGSSDCAGVLPSGYTEVEYIENTSDAYINLDISPYTTNGNSFTVQCTFSSYTQSSFGYLISCEYCGQDPYYGFILRWNSSLLKLEGGSVGVDTTAQITSNGDGTSAVTFHSDSTSTSNSGTPITLFCGLCGATVWRNGKGRLYNLSMLLNNTVVRNLVPCIRDNDNKVGMYDTANDVFYYSPNTNQLIAGPQV